MSASIIRIMNNHNNSNILYVQTRSQLLSAYSASHAQGITIYRVKSANYKTLQKPLFRLSIQTQGLPGKAQLTSHHSVAPRFLVYWYKVWDSDIHYHYFIVLMPAPNSFGNNRYFLTLIIIFLEKWALFLGIMCLTRVPNHV